MIRHGFYQSPSRTAYPVRYNDYLKEQASRGMTTATADCSDHFCVGNAEEALACNIEMLLDAGLAFPGEPLLCFADPTTAYGANKRSTRPWPEIVMNNLDDPSPDEVLDAQKMTRNAHRLYFRSSLFVAGSYLKEGKKFDPDAGLLGEAADIWIVQAPTWQHDTEKNAKALGKELWAAYTVGAAWRYEHCRYYSGLWAWAHKPKQVLVWAYNHTASTFVGGDGTLSIHPGDNNSFAIPRMDGTVMSTPGYDGFSDGVVDCRVLEASEKSEYPDIQDYLKYVKGTVPCAMPRPGRPLPALQGSEVMSKLGALLSCLND